MGQPELGWYPSLRLYDYPIQLQEFQPSQQKSRQHLGSRWGREESHLSAESAPWKQSSKKSLLQICLHLSHQSWQRPQVCRKCSPEAMAPYSSTPAWKIPWMEEPGRLQSMGSLRIRTEWLHFHFSLSCIGEGNGNQSSVLAWRIPRMGEPGGLPSMELQRVGHDWSDLAAAATAGVRRE